MKLKKYLVLCDCKSSEHQVILQYFEDEKPEWQELYIDVHLYDYKNFFKRIWTGIRYIFGYKSKYGKFDEIVVNPTEVREIINFLQAFLEKCPKE